MNPAQHIAEMTTFDQRHIWHPYTSATRPQPCYLVESAQGVTLRLADGRELTDGISSWWAVIHGYNHPQINQAVSNQLKRMAHVMFAGLTHEAAITLTQRLLMLAPAQMQHVFYSDSGSVAVEIAMKMALQYWYAQGQPAKCRFATVRSGYHGDTWHAMSVCDPQDGMHSIFNGRLSVQHFVARPACRFDDEWQQNDLDAIEALFHNYHHEIAAFVIEPIVQGAGGMHFYHPQYLAGLAQLCRHHNILLIADEIATGFGRTGRMFACEWAQVQPDILCVGKGLTGGYLPMAATLTSARVAEGISNGAPGLFMHGPTFMANPLACAAANASLRLLQDRPVLAEVSRIQRMLRNGLAEARQFACVADVRVLGAIGVVELTHEVDPGRLIPLLVTHGIWLRPFGRLIYLMPAYVISETQLQQVLNALMICLDAYAAHTG